MSNGVEQRQLGSDSARGERDSRRPTCIYIASRGHSGSTLLEVLLGRHPQIASAGEVANLGLQCLRDGQTSWRGQCGCGERPFDCPIWGRVLERIEDEYGFDMRTQPLAFKISDVGLEEEHRSKAFRRLPFVWARNAFWRMLRQQQYAGSPLLAKLSRFYEPQREWAANRSFVLKTLAQIRSVTAVVDSSKDPLGMRDMYDFAPLPVKILFLTRDCRGNVWSFAKRNGYLQHRRRETLSRAARDWVAVNGRIRQLLDGVAPQDWMQVQYEELCRDSRATLRTIFEFIGVANDDSVLEDREHLEHTIAGNRIRLSNTRANIAEDTAWEKHLDRDDLAAIAKIAAPLARTFGYQV
jgi:hypothetical protein